MKPNLSHARIFCVLWIVVIASGQAAPLERVRNTTLANMPLALPTLNFTATNAFPNLIFNNPIGIYSPPGETNRLFILEKRGRIVVITNLVAPTRSIFMDITGRVIGSDTSVGAEEGLLGLAFHPGYLTNRYFYVFYTGNATTTPGSGRHDILSRFEISASDPNQAETNTEVRLLLQRDEASNHNGGELQFGPDGYLYVSLGDEGGGDNSFFNAQFINKDFFSGILRLDVDKRPGSLTPNAHAATTTNYTVPPDNPFVGATSFNGLAVNPATVRTEFWAAGQRNPWRMSFDPVTGLLYCADVGQSRLEEINIIEKGENAGWAWFEGTFQRTNSIQIPAGFVNAPPLLQYGRTNGIAVVGGVVYRGTRLTQLYGAYVYGDYGSGRIWALRHSGSTVLENRLLLTDDLNGSGLAGISAFGVDPGSGYILYADEQNATDGRIKRIVPASTTGAPIPLTLAETGAFNDLATLTPNAGIVSYEIKVPFWSDHATKTRWFSVPNTNLTIGFSRESNWSFPTGTVWIKHFELELTNGVPSSRQRLETRLLVKNASGGYGVTYRWGDSLTNATLVPDEGMDESFVINDGGLLRTQVWHYPGRVECLQCHTLLGGFALGFNTPQVNRDFDYGGTVTNQIAALSLAGYFNTNVTGIHTLRSLAGTTDTSVSREYRVRSYLAANCVQCHQPSGAAQALWDARITTTTASAGLINGPLFNAGGNPNTRIVVPGSPADSMLLSRISTLGPSRMPPLDSTVLDTQAIALITAWITNDLPGEVNFVTWQSNYFGSTNAPNAGPDSDADGDGARNYLEFLTQTNPTNSLDAWSISIGINNDFPQILFPQIANRGFEVQAAASLSASSWSPLDVPANAPFFSVSNRNAVIVDGRAVATNQFYRVRVFTP